MAQRTPEERAVALGSVRFLDRFHDGEEESRRPAHTAFIPVTTG